MCGSKVNAYPLVSVVTIVRNDAQGFLVTAASVLRQDYPRVEWIVIDGLSSDGTSEYVKRLAPRISHYRIERDNGIYDAMNKGIDLASGDWIFFMNADDVFYASTTISQYVSAIRAGDDVLYSDVIRREDGAIHLYPPADQFWAGMITDHQTTCVRGSIYKDLKYDVTYKVAGDFDFLSRARREGANFRKITGLIGCRKPFVQGVSSDYPGRQKERLRVIKRYFPQHPWKEMLRREFSNAAQQRTIDADSARELVAMLEE